MIAEIMEIFQFVIKIITFSSVLKLFCIHFYQIYQCSIESTCGHILIIVGVIAPVSVIGIIVLVPIIVGCFIISALVIIVCVVAPALIVVTTACIRGETFSVPSKSTTIFGFKVLIG
jgi:hypothetical protein